MLLTSLLNNVELKQNEEISDLEISGIAYDSRKVKPGDLFVCIEGYQSDGHRYIKNAIENGAAAIVVEKDVPDYDILTVRVTDSRKALAFISANFYDNPADKLRIIGVTGTNGKTSVTYMIKNILEGCGYKVGLIGTNQNMIGSIAIKTERTTPESLELNALFAEMVKAKVNYVVMEVSSHSLYLQRVAMIHFVAGAVTNITQDHLDFHKTMDEYFKAKSMLFKKSNICVLNKDDAYYEGMVEEAIGHIVTYGQDITSDYCAYDILTNVNGCSFNVRNGAEDYRAYLSIPGSFTVYNALLAIAVTSSLGIPAGFIRMSLKKQEGIKGRMEVVDTGTDFKVIIDYAHSPDGLLNLLKSINEFKEKRVITVFGCGGDRDSKKRSIMGAIAAENSDFVVVTSDNPRTEEPMSIINDILEGIAGLDCNYKVIENRKEAIGYALGKAEAGDIVVLAGKGHETYQILKNETIHFDEREIIKEYI